MECCYRPTVLDALAGTSSSYSRSTEYEIQAREDERILPGSQLQNGSCLPCSKLRSTFAPCVFGWQHIERWIQTSHDSGWDTPWDTYLGWEALTLENPIGPVGLVLLLFEAKIFGAFLANDPDFYTGMSQHVCVFFFVTAGMLPPGHVMSPELLPQNLKWNPQ